MARLADWVIAVVERLGALGVGLLVALESVVPPIPSELILPLAGFVASRGSLGLWSVVVAATVGAVAGALLLYGIGARLGPQRVRRPVERHGRWVMLDAEDMERSATWMRRHGDWAVLGGRMVPGVRSLVSLPAGFAGMPLPRFVALTALGSGAWNLALVWLGFTLGQEWRLVGEWVGRVGNGVWILLLALLAILLTKRWRARRERGKAPRPDR